jgi:hypothetical protein
MARPQFKPLSDRAGDLGQQRLAVGLPGAPGGHRGVVVVPGRVDPCAKHADLGIERG